MEDREAGVLLADDEKTSWAGQPDSRAKLFYENDPAAFEPMHCLLRAGEPLMAEIGNIAKKAGGKEAVQLLIARVKELKKEVKLQALAYMLQTWLDNSFADGCTCSLYSAFSLPSNSFPCGIGRVG